MKTQIVDTNVLVRFLVGDNLPQKAQAECWFKEAEEGKRTLVVIPLVIAETGFVLESFYKLKRGDIADALEVFVTQRWLRVEEREVLRSLWPAYRQGLHFVDSYLRAWTKIYEGDILTFDKKLQR